MVIKKKVESEANSQPAFVCQQSLHGHIIIQVFSKSHTLLIFIDTSTFYTRGWLLAPFFHIYNLNACNHHKQMRIWLLNTKAAQKQEGSEEVNMTVISIDICKYQGDRVITHHWQCFRPNPVQCYYGFCSSLPSWWRLASWLPTKNFTGHCLWQILSGTLASETIWQVIWETKSSLIFTKTEQRVKRLTELSQLRLRHKTPTAQLTDNIYMGQK